MQTRSTSIHAAERLIALAGTYSQALGAVARTFAEAQRQALSAIEALFWVGAALAHAEALAPRTRDFHRDVQSRTGMSEAAIKRSLDLYDACEGDVEQVRGWIAAQHAATGEVLMQHADQMLTANAGHIGASRDARHTRTRLVAAGEDPPDITAADLGSDGPDLSPVRKESPRAVSFRLGPLATDVRGVIEAGYSQKTVRTVEHGGHTYDVVVTRREDEDDG